MTITIGKDENAHEREIVIDPEQIPMGLLDDLQEAGDLREWKVVKPIIIELFGLTNDEYRALTARQFLDLASALTNAVGVATAPIPNGP